MTDDDDRHSSRDDGRRGSVPQRCTERRQDISRRGNPTCPPGLGKLHRGELAVHATFEDLERRCETILQPAVTIGGARSTRARGPPGKRDRDTPGHHHDADLECLEIDRRVTPHFDEGQGHRQDSAYGDTGGEQHESLPPP